MWLSVLHTSKYNVKALSLLVDIPSVRYFNGKPGKNDCKQTLGFNQQTIAIESGQSVV